MLRSLIRLVHLWTALIFGLFIGVVALTGSYLVFERYGLIAEFGSHALVVEETDQHPLPAQRWVDNITQLYPDRDDPFLVMGPHLVFDIDSALVFYWGDEQGNPGFDAKAVNPYSGDFLGDVSLTPANWSVFPRFVHETLLFPFGDQLVSFLGVLIVLFAGSGIYLWWPRKQSIVSALTWRKNLKGMAFQYQLHNFTGITSALLIVLVSVSGIWQLTPGWIDPIANLFSDLRVEAYSEEDLATLDSCEAPPPDKVGLSQAAAIAQRQMPDHHIRYLGRDTNPKHDDPYEIRMSSGNDFSFLGDTIVIVGRQCPKVLLVREGDSLSASEVIKAASGTLHFGRFWGWAGKLIIAISGLALTTLFVSGLLRYIMRLKRRRQVRTGPNN